MQIKKYIYLYRYDDTESALCKLESKCIFNREEENRLLLSDIEIEPSTSAFLKKRIDVISFSEDYESLIKQVKKENIQIEDFKVEYFVFEGDKTEYPGRLEKLKDIGYSIEGNPDYHKPTTTYALCCYDGNWCFGLVVKNNLDWRKHQKKPYSYSNSIGINTAKALVNIAAKGNKESKLLDACCGVGTVMLEACFAGYDMEGCDISWKICKNARGNLAHFNYKTTIFRSDIKDISKSYDAAIIDLPYNLFSFASDDDISHIIESTAKIADRIVIISTTDIADLISNVGFKVLDHCSVPKMGKTSFVRRVWVCEREGITEP